MFQGMYPKRQLDGFWRPFYYKHSNFFWKMLLHPILCGFITCLNLETALIQQSNFLNGRNILTKKIIRRNVKDLLYIQITYSIHYYKRPKMLLTDLNNSVCIFTYTFTVVTILSQFFFLLKHVIVSFHKRMKYVCNSLE